MNESQVATSCCKLQYICNTMQYIATRCNTLQHARNVAQKVRAAAL